MSTLLDSTKITSLLSRNFLDTQ